MVGGLLTAKFTFLSILGFKLHSHSDQFQPLPVKMCSDPLQSSFCISAVWCFDGLCVFAFLFSQYSESLGADLVSRDCPERSMEEPWGEGWGRQGWGHGGRVHLMERRKNVLYLFPGGLMYRSGKPQGPRVILPLPPF